MDNLETNAGKNSFVNFLFWSLAILLGAWLASRLSPILTFFLFILIIFYFFLIRNLDFALILLIFFFPYLGLVIDFSPYRIFRSVPFLNQLNAPFIDFYGLFLFVVWLSLKIFELFKEKKISQFFASFSHWKSFSLFALAGLISLRNVPLSFLGSSFKYLLRPFLFFYFAFFAPTVDIIKKYGKNFLIQIFGALYATGLISALIGFLSFFLVPPEGFPRATPFAFLGIAPLGFNHNLLAETLVVTAPFGFLLSWLEAQKEKISGEKSSRKTRLFWGSVFQVFIALTTFARTAWIALTCQLIIFALLFYRGQVKEILKKIFLFFLVSLPLFIYLIWSMSTEVVRGSTLTRLDMVRISWFNFLRHPLIGNGPGTFVPNLWQVKAFLLEYGEPLEAHGILWKLLFEQGLLGAFGFFFFCLIIFYTLFKAYFSLVREKKEVGRVIVLTMIVVTLGIFIYEFFNTTYYTSKMWVPIGVAVGVASLYLPQKKQEEKFIEK